MPKKDNSDKEGQNQKDKGRINVDSKKKKIYKDEDDCWQIKFGTWIYRVLSLIL